MKGPMFGRTDGRAQWPGELLLYIFCLEWPRIPLNKYQVFFLYFGRSAKLLSDPRVNALKTAIFVIQVLVIHPVFL